MTENLIEFKFPGDPLLWTVYFNLTFNSILLVISRRRFRFGFKLHFTVLPGLVPCILWKEKVARQLVALCLVSSLGHNTCVFLSNQPDVPCRQAVAGDVVLNLRRHWNKQRRLKLKCRRRERADISHPMRPHSTHMLLCDILGQASDHNCVIWGCVPPVFLSRRPGKDCEMWLKYSGLANLSLYRPGLRSRLLSRLLLLSSSALSLQDLLMRMKNPCLNARVLM